MIHTISVAPKGRYPGPGGDWSHDRRLRGVSLRRLRCYVPVAHRDFERAVDDLVTDGQVVIEPVVTGACGALVVVPVVQQEERNTE